MITNEGMKLAKDSYNAFLDNFKINEDEFIRYGIKQVLMTPETIAINDWQNLKKCILNGGDKVHIRSYGVKGQNSHLYLDLYVNHFTKAQIGIDKTNNQKASTKIFNLLKFNKKYKSPNDSTLLNYQSSHVFSKTKNPFCFLAPWNIVLIPKIFDPLTGHEAKGKLVEKFTKTLKQEVYNRFHHQIEDFNHVMNQHAEELLLKFEKRNGDMEGFEEHFLNLKAELAKITLEE